MSYNFVPPWCVPSSSEPCDMTSGNPRRCDPRESSWRRDNPLASTSMTTRRESNNTEKDITYLYLQSTSDSVLPLCTLLGAHLIHEKAVSMKTANRDIYLLDQHTVSRYNRGLECSRKHTRIPHVPRAGSTSTFMFNRNYYNFTTKIAIEFLVELYRKKKRSKLMRCLSGRPLIISRS